MRNPSDSGSANDRLARLSPAQRELLSRRIQTSVAAPSTANTDATIPHRVVPGQWITLSAAQRRIWFFERLQPGTGAYNLYAHFRLDGPLDAGAAESAFRGLVARHDALRTVFTDIGGEPHQCVLANAPFTLQRRDLSAMAAEDQAAETDRIMAAETAHAFDLSQPLFRASLLRLGDGAHVLLMVVHHMVSDAWSCGLLLGEFQTLYTADADKRDARLEPLAIGYADTLLWEQQPSRRARAEAQIAYWQEALAGCTGMLDLPVDRPRAAVPSGRGARYRFAIERPLANSFAEFARQAHATQFMAWLCAFQVLVARLTGQCDVVIGSPFANRGRRELEPLVGLFVNTLPLRGDLSGDPSLRTLLERIRAHCLDALDHADVPLERIVEQVRIERAPGRTPLFQSMFVLQNDGAPLELPGLHATRLEPEIQSSRFELTLLLCETPDGFDCAFDYDSDLFAEATVARWSRSLTTLANDAVASPDRPFSQLALLAPGDFDELVGLADGGHCDLAAHDLLQPLTEQVRRTPDAFALVEPGGSLTYSQLDRRLHDLAATLQAAGVGIESRVGVLADRSIESVVAILATLAAGGTYVPLDPTLSDERLRFMLADAGAGVLLVPPALRDRVADLADCTHVMQTDGDGASGAFVPPAIEPHNAAYVIYTSGSTGRPKGVVVEHRGALNLLRGFLARHAFAGQRLLMIPPLIFDASVGDVFPVLASGATLVIHPDPARLGASELRAFCCEHGVTAIDAPAALWRRWAEGGAFVNSDAAPAGLRLIMIGGESVPLSLVRSFAAATDASIVLTNHYGPTEASVCATVLSTSDARELLGDDLAIGTPLPGVRTYVLDRHGQLSPRGSAGELYIGGAGVARGYVGQPALTAERFVPDPFAGVAGARMYRTGDVARWDAAGHLQFLGRRDNQTKLRGVRVELGEIEAAIASYPGITAACATVREDRAGDRRLVAYVICNGPIAHSALRNHLSQRLPEAVLPSAVVQLPVLPLTPNGKVDRRALPAPASTDGPQRTARAPSTATERAVLAIWAEVLGRDDLGVDDDFFASGGDSLLTLPLVFRLHAALGVELPLSTVFSAPTVGGLAREIDARRAGGAVEVVDLARHVVLPADIDPRRASPPLAPRSTPRSALVTGATGFLGAYIVRELLDITSAEVVCLVRARDREEGLQRIRGNLETYGLWRLDDAHRIVPLPADLAEHRLGLDDATFADLASRVDVVFHNGGQVNFLAPFEHLEAANVGGTREVLRLAATSHVKSVHLVSTLGVYLTERHLDRVVTEIDAPPDGGGQGGGYNQSKWVGEQIALIARERGLPVAIHRPARITADSRTGASNAGDYFNSWIKGCIQLGLAPALPDESFDMAPVDYVGRAIVRIALGADDPSGNFHFYNARRLPITDAVDALREQGFPLREVPYAEWRSALLSASAASRENALAPFAGLFPNIPDPREPRFDCSRTEQAVEAHGLTLPPADTTLFATGVRFLKACGFLPAAEEVGA